VGGPPARTGTALRWAPFAVLIAGWLALYPGVQWYVNPDGVAYTALAEHWLGGRWSAAVSGYWSPLLTWLLVPLLAIGVTPALAIRLLLLGSAVLTLVALRRLALAAGVSEPVTDGMRLVASPILVWASLFRLGPDLLIVPLLLAWCGVVLGPGFSRARTAGLQAGALAAAAYLAKAYALPFLAVHGLLAFGAQAQLAGSPTARRRVLANAGVAVATLAVLAGPWIATVSAAYGRPTCTTAAGFNAALVSPGSDGNPLNEPGLYARVEFVGHLPRRVLEREFNIAWVQVAPGRWEEPFGNVVTESMMRGTAVVATRLGGPAGIVLDGVTGALVPPDDVPALADALRALLADRALAERLGQAGREVALAEYDQARVAERFEQLYLQVIPDPLRAPSPAV